MSRILYYRLLKLIQPKNLLNKLRSECQLLMNWLLIKKRVQSGKRKSIETIMKTAKLNGQSILLCLLVKHSALQLYGCLFFSLVETLLKYRKFESKKNSLHTIEQLKVYSAIFKSWNEESGKGMRRVIGTRKIRVGTQGIKVGMWGIRVGMLGIRVRMQGMGVGMQGIKVGIRGMGVRMRGIRAILCENLCVYCFG